MNKHLISIHDLPPDGKEFIVEDQAVWTEPIAEFGMDYTITKPLKMTLFVQPADEGVLLRGKLEGAVAAPCNRCAETANITIHSMIDEYEEIPHAPGSSADMEPSALIVFENNSPMLSLADVAWEQFMLAIPANPLCQEDCKGICPECGTNLNTGSCECKRENIDPRLAPLASLKIK